MRVFLAGGTGAIGRRLVPQLVARGHQVTATTTSAARLSLLKELGAEAVVMDGLSPGWLVTTTRLVDGQAPTDTTQVSDGSPLTFTGGPTDVFVAALLSGLVLLDNLATVEPGPGVLAFGSVVYLTMVATMTFDQRLLWDAAEPADA